MTIEGGFLMVEEATIRAGLDHVDKQFVASESDVNNTMRHQYRVLSDEEKAAMVRIKDLGLEFVQSITNCVPNGREASLAKTKIEEAVMWAVKGITN
jgi:hypothetical protein